MTRNEARTIAQRVPGVLDSGRVFQDSHPETFNRYWIGYYRRLEDDLRLALNVLALPVDPSIRLENI